MMSTGDVSKLHTLLRMQLRCCWHLGTSARMAARLEQCGMWTISARREDTQVCDRKCLMDAYTHAAMPPSAIYVAHGF